MEFGCMMMYDVRFVRKVYVDTYRTQWFSLPTDCQIYQPMARTEADGQRPRSWEYTLRKVDGCRGYESKPWYFNENIKIAGIYHDLLFMDVKNPQILV
jgi:hypothetical protein